MIDTQKFFDGKIKPKFGLITGVPCSFFKGLVNAASNSGLYLPAVDEGAAIAIATGYQITSNKPALVLMQNSGIGNAVSPLTSLSTIFDTPITMMVSHRGFDGDEPQHELMGRIDRTMLELCRVLVTDIHENTDFNVLPHHRKAYIVPKGTFDMVELTNAGYIAPYGSKSELEHDDIGVVCDLYPIASRINELAKIRSAIHKHHSKTGRKFIIVATTGYTGRELWSLGDDVNNLYMVGSMGCALPLALGMAIGNPDIDIYCIDGDGALLMRTGSLATFGEVQPKNLKYFLLDNNSYATTGGQRTSSNNVDFSGLAESMGIRSTEHPVIESFLQNPNVNFAYFTISPENAKVGRPTRKPKEVLKDLIQYINS